ncbi:disulfide bond formation protein B [Consotaella aegiceratis]|uniref:disulfide bond formation protein B n=1 Tax=Consotaella aegiceratis TaxID=3097961 RepID=UPI002F3F7E38
MSQAFSRPAGNRQTVASAVLLVGSVATITSALLFQYVGGYMPCELCLLQRWPYYLSAPLALVALAAAAGRAPAMLTRGLLVVIGLLMLFGFGTAIYHAGVEWHFWAGPADCTSSGGVDLSGDLLSAIDTIKPPACDEAPWRMLGLSFAGWNVLASLVFVVVAFWGASAKPNRWA